MAGFYPARSRIIPPLPWQTFSPPLSLPAVNRQVGPLNLLGPEGMEKIHKFATKILADIGIVFRDARALDRWKKPGPESMESIFTYPTNRSSA